MVEHGDGKRPMTEEEKKEQIKRLVACKGTKFEVRNVAHRAELMIFVIYSQA